MDLRYFKNFSGGSIHENIITKCFTSIRKTWSIVAVCEIKVHEIENESPFLKHLTGGNYHLYGTFEQLLWQEGVYIICQTG